MIRRLADGSHYCDGRYCGFPLAWYDCDPSEGADGLWVCLDCGASMYAAAPVAIAARGEEPAPVTNKPEEA